MSARSFLLSLTLLTACGNSSDADAGRADAGPATCASPGMASVGAADTHCDPGIVQTVDPASCAGDPDSGVVDDAGTSDVDAGVVVCEYGDPLFGMEGDDDDCKYHFTWTSTPICEGAAGTFFTVTVTNKSDGSAVTGADMRAETFVPGGPACDAIPSRTGPNSFVHLREGPSGTYSGPVVFDRAAEWIVRFHVFETCSDVPEDSPHGHVAFRITVP